MESNASSSEQPHKSNRLSISLSWPIIALILVVIIAVMLIIWKPWSGSPPDESRVVSVTGESTISAEPDEFVFSPYYQFKSKNKDSALAELNKKSDEVVAKIKQLGVDDSKIKTDSSGYNYDYYYDSTNQNYDYNLHLTITVENREKAQKVQDYLITTGPTGSVSPSANFSDQKRKQIESQARDEATKDARAKADQSANNLGFKIGKVKSVEDGTGFDNQPFYRSMDLQAGDSAAAAEKGLSVQPGENDLNYSVKVVYYLK